MKYKTALISLLILLLLSAFAQNPKPAGSSLLRPLLALPLPEGRTLDEGHDSGFIDWSGAVGYVNLNHKDGICPTGCVEQVTRISNGGTVSGAFAPVDVAYFEVMVAFTHNSGAGTAILNACGSSAAWYLYVGPGSGLPGFVSMSVPVPAGCTSWSLSASGGYVDFRSVDANYVSPPPPVSTNTFTTIPTETFSPTGTMTPSPTATETLTPTATETLAPGVTPSDTPTPTDTPLPTLTSTPSQTLPPGVTPSDTPIPTVTPVPTIGTNTPKPLPSGSGQGGNPPVVPFAAFPTATQTRSVAAIVPTASVIKTSTSAPASTSTPRLIVTLPAGELACTPSTGSDFPWWLLPAGLTLASAFSLLGTLVKNLNLDTASLQVGDFSISPFGVTLRVPRLVPRVTTVGEWVTRPIRTLVQITRTIFRTIVEAIPRFITVTRQVIDRIVHSEWVTTFRQVAKTFWETVTEKVPLLGFLGKVIGFIWKTVVKPVIRWVTEAIRTLRTWVENVARWVVERIQDGWNYITRQIAETVREWVEKTEWVREFVSRRITVWETVWETKHIPFPFPTGGGKVAALAPAAWSRVLTQLGVTVTLGTLAVTLQKCPASTDVPCTPTPAANLTSTAFAGATQTVMAFTPTPAPTATPTPFQFPVDKVFTANNQIFTCNDVALYFGITLDALLNANPGLNCNAVNIGVTQFNIPPLTLKSPGEYVSQYNCVPTADKPICLSPNASAEEMLAYTLFNEGGSSEGNQFSANVMQVILNRANKILDNWGIDRSQMSRDDYARLVLYVISKPAASGANVAAFEAFSSPSEAPIPNADSGTNWNTALQIAQAALDNKGQDWAQSAPIQPKDYVESGNVLFYCSVRTPENPPLGFSGHLPEQGTGPNGVITYFFNGYQYNQSVAQWCQDNR